MRSRPRQRGVRQVGTVLGMVTASSNCRQPRDEGRVVLESVRPHGKRKVSYFIDGSGCAVDWSISKQINTPSSHDSNGPPDRRMDELKGR